jgi:small subunit ribosomal protein S9
MAEIAQYLGTGKRKTSVARVILRPGDGKTWINGRTLEEYFPRAAHRVAALAPLKTAGADGTYDLRVRVHGGGITGQAGAVRHGIARALVEADPSCGPARARGLTRATTPGRAQEGWPAQGAQGAAILQTVGLP